MKRGGTMHKRCVLRFGMSNEEETKIFLNAVQSSLNPKMMSLSIENDFRFSAKGH